MFNKNSVIIGFDFSINKPACCIFKNNIYTFISWPYGLSDSILNIYKKTSLNLIERTDNKDKGNNISDKIRYEINNSSYLANLIINSIKPYFVNDNTFISFEGFSYASKGDAVSSLIGYKYILINYLSKYVSLENMFTYAPISLKKTAGCSQKGSKKSDIIESFINEPNTFSKLIKENKTLFQTKKGNWIIHIDDIADSYFALKTHIEKSFNKKGEILL